MSRRAEKDSLGPVWVPAEAYYGPQTQRAVENFPISGILLPSGFIHSLALVKKCAARVNMQLELLAHPLADAIDQAAGEVLDGKLADQFVVDVFQTGSGTSSNMNMNEVLASRANEILTGHRGGNRPCIPMTTSISASRATTSSLRSFTSPPWKPCATGWCRR